jgi:hypothetical protein
LSLVASRPTAPPTCSPTAAAGPSPDEQPKPASGTDAAPASPVNINVIAANCFLPLIESPREKVKGEMCGGDRSGTVSLRSTEKGGGCR